jgi:hypothetical protein
MKETVKISNPMFIGRRLYYVGEHTVEPAIAALMKERQAALDAVRLPAPPLKRTGNLTRSEFHAAFDRYVTHDREEAIRDAASATCEGKMLVAVDLEALGFTVVLETAAVLLRLNIIEA